MSLLPLHPGIYPCQASDVNSSCTPRAALRFEAGDAPASAAPRREENLASEMHSFPARLGLRLGLQLEASPLRRVPTLTGKPCLNTRGSRREGGGPLPGKPSLLLPTSPQLGPGQVWEGDPGARE